MLTKNKMVRKEERQVSRQSKGKPDIEKYEKKSGKKLDVNKAPGIDIDEKLETEWKHEETERKLEESGSVTKDEMEIGKVEEEGEGTSPEVEEAISDESDEEEEKEEEKEEEDKEKEEEE